MIRTHQPLRRRTDGTVDIDFYRQQVLASRADAGFTSDRRPWAWALVTMGITLTVTGALVVVSLAAAALVQIVNAALAGAA